MNRTVVYLAAVVLVAMGLTAGFTGFFVADTPGSPSGEINTFIDNGQDPVYVDGKPVIRLYSTTACPHCTWVKETYDRVAKEYVAEGKIIAYHWEYKTSDGVWDDTLTGSVEGTIPISELDVFDRFNPANSIPTFVFGEKYYRIGTGYERQSDLLAEEKEFRAVIESLLKS
jgi:thiol-disulfide isomerase/thioredoxin